jgi:hypothetical protein
MVILINLGTSAVKVEYKSQSNNKAFSKLLPTGAFVAMKDLDHSWQLSNKTFLSLNNVTIYDYEASNYVYYSPNTPTGATLPFKFIGSNDKPHEAITYTAAGLGTTTTTTTGVTVGYQALKALM